MNAVAWEAAGSVVVAGFVESDVVLGVDHVVGGVDVVALKHLLKHLWLVHCALLHEVNDLILDDDGLVYVVV